MYEVSLEYTGLGQHSASVWAHAGTYIWCLCTCVQNHIRWMILVCACAHTRLRMCIHMSTGTIRTCIHTYTRYMYYINMYLISAGCEIISSVTSLVPSATTIWINKQETPEGCSNFFRHSAVSRFHIRTVWCTCAKVRAHVCVSTFMYVCVVCVCIYIYIIYMHVYIVRTDIPTFTHTHTHTVEWCWMQLRHAYDLYKYVHAYIDYLVQWPCVQILIRKRPCSLHAGNGSFVACINLPCVYMCLSGSM
jgi:hypothetical protein